MGGQIFSELSTITAQLEARKQLSKLRLYRRFTRIMAICVLLSLGWSSYEVYITSSSAETFDLRWKTYWTLEAVWPVIFLAVLLTIMWLWAPSKNAIRYAYSEELALDDDYIDEEEDNEGEASEMASGGASLKMNSLSARVHPEYIQTTNTEEDKRS